VKITTICNTYRFCFFLKKKDLSQSDSSNKPKLRIQSIRCRPRYVQRYRFLYVSPLLSYLQWVSFLFILRVPLSFIFISKNRWYSNVSSFPSLDTQTEIGAPYQFEYSARKAYGQNISWPVDAPLNATYVINSYAPPPHFFQWVSYFVYRWWHLVTEQWEANPSLVQTFTTYQVRISNSSYSTFSK
jgi:hypothetical protein